MRLGTTGGATSAGEGGRGLDLVRAMLRPGRRPTSATSSGRLASGGACPGLRNSSTPTRREPSVSGNAPPDRRPVCSAASSRSDGVSGSRSSRQTGSPAAQARPGKEPPFSRLASLVGASSSPTSTPGACQNPWQRRWPPRPSRQSTPTGQPRPVPTALRTRRTASGPRLSTSASATAVRVAFSRSASSRSVASRHRMAPSGVLGRR